MKFIDLLNKYKGQKIYYRANRGNGGDALIAAGTFKCWDNCGVSY
jgi:hypothetical protein